MLPAAYKTHAYQTIRLAYPICLSQLGHVGVGIADTVFAGMIGTKEQAAVALANSLYSLILVFGIGISYGVTPLVAAAHSKNQDTLISTLLKNALLINTITCSLLFLFLYFASFSFRHFEQDKQVVELAIPFFNVMIFSLLPLSVFLTLKQFTEGLSFTKAAMAISIGGNLLNIFLNYVLIFGHLGIKPMGIMGSCWATFISRVLMAIGLVCYVWLKKDFQIYIQQFNTVSISKKLTIRLLKIGFPSGLQFIFEVGAFSCAVIMAGQLGVREQAAHQIALTLATITYMLASGISAATTVRVGNMFGLKNKMELRNAGFSSVAIICLVQLSCALIFIALHRQLPYCFNTEIAVVEIASTLLIIAALFQVSDGIQVVCLGALRGMEDTKIPTIITLFAYWIISLPLSYFLAFYMHMGIEGVWYGLFIGLTVAAILLYWRFNHISKSL